jgi:hypothetical protein
VFGRGWTITNMQNIIKIAFHCQALHYR